MLYYEINEQIARAAQNMMSMSEYPEGRATSEYRAAVDIAARLVEQQKGKVSPYYYEKLDRLLDSYSRRLAQWTNDHNRNAASCPSILICGAGNFPVHKKEKQNAREDTLWKEYNEINGILDKIKSVGTGPIDLNDPHARELLTEQLTKMQTILEQHKTVNAYWRKHKTASGCPDITEHTAEVINNVMADTNSFPHMYGKPYPDYELSSIRGKIKRLQSRLADLDKLQEEQKRPADATKFSGGEIRRNASENRLQIVFDNIPDIEVRQALKSHGFRWSPKNNAWQRQLTKNAEYNARHILNLS